jgi:hypothetical protein
MWSIARKIAFNGCIAFSLLVAALWVKSLLGGDFLYIPVRDVNFLILESHGGGLAIVTWTAPRTAPAGTRIRYLSLAGRNAPLLAPQTVWKRPAFKRQRDGNWNVTCPHLLLVAALIAEAVAVRIYERRIALSSLRAAKAA